MATANEAKKFENVTALFGVGGSQGGPEFVQFTIVVYEEDADHFYGKLFDQAKSIFYAQKQKVTPLVRIT